MTRTRRGVVAAVLALVVLGLLGPRTAHAARISYGGHLPAIQKVGGVYTAYVWFKNNGKGVAHPVVDLSGMTDHWVMDRLTTNMGSGQHSSHGDYWRFGYWKHGATFRIYILFSPKDVGNHNFDVQIWDGWDSPYGIPTKAILASLSGTVAINP